MAGTRRRPDPATYLRAGLDARGGSARVRGAWRGLCHRPPMSVDELIDQWQQAWSGKDPDAFGPLCAADLHYEDPLTAEPLEGVDELTRHAQRLWAGFPDVRLERTGERLANRRYVAAPCKLLGTHKAPLE